MLVSNKKYDLVIYGASGFTGQLICEYLSTHKDTSSLSWAIAGRNKSKLEEKLNTQIKENIELKKEVSLTKRDELIRDISTDLVETEVEKLKELS